MLKTNEVKTTINITFDTKTRTFIYRLHNIPQNIKMETKIDMLTAGLLAILKETRRNIPQHSDEIALEKLLRRGGLNELAKRLDESYTADLHEYNKKKGWIS